ncbi:hypothetical protein AWC11_07280 [Mycobacterium interjectum]|nr:hypothetical protein AWC11_07280 [Mycobacterium interjectum]
MAAGYRVTGALVVVRDQMGKNHHLYHGAFVPWLSEEQREHFLRHSLVEEIKGQEAETATAAVPAKPAKTAPVAAWVEYGVSQGQDRDELEALGKENKQQLIDLLS